MKNNWKIELEKLWVGNVNLLATSSFLKTLKEKGIRQQEVQEHLEDLRSKVPEDVEDKILEVLDIVAGYCQLQYRVW